MTFEPHCWAEIDLDALAHNFKLIQAQVSPAPVCAVVKAAAYGHGDTMVARTLQDAGAAWFAVSCCAEAVNLRKAGITKDILILGHTDPTFAAQLAKHKLTQAVFSPEYAAALSASAAAAGVQVCVHLKIDTGMGRIGFGARDAQSVATCVDALAACYALPAITVGGIFQHFAVADSAAADNIDYTNRQHELFLAVLEKLSQRGYTPEWVHCDNSAGLSGHPAWAHSMVRSGIVMYGYNPSHEVILPGLRPVLSLKTVISQVKPLEVGQSVSYGRLYTAETRRTVATLCAGYADGYPRLMTGKGICEIGGQPAPLVGRICMDQMLADVTELPAVKAGDTVTLFGAGGIADTAEDVGDKIGTISYEILCGVGLRVPRIYLQNGKQVSAVNYLTDTPAFSPAKSNF